MLMQAVHHHGKVSYAIFAIILGLLYYTFSFKMSSLRKWHSVEKKKTPNLDLKEYKLENYFLKAE